MATQTALWELQKALFKRLSSDLVPGKVTGVHDVAAAEHVHPYITLSEPISRPLETKTTYSEEISIVAHVWSAYDGKKEAYDILNAVFQAIGRGLSIEGPFTVLRVKKPELQVIDDADPRLKHGIARLTITIRND